MDAPLENNGGSGNIETLTLEPISSRRGNVESIEIPRARREESTSNEESTSRVYAANALGGENGEERRLYGLRGGPQEEITRTYHLTTSAEPVTATLEEEDRLAGGAQRQGGWGRTELDQMRERERVAEEKTQRYALQKKAKEDSKPRRTYPWEV